MTGQLDRDVSKLVGVVREHHPACPEWQLTLNVEDFLRLDVSRRLVSPAGAAAPARGVFCGCLVWVGPAYPDTVVCSPLVLPGQWELPPEYYLDLRDGSISTQPPALTVTGVGRGGRTSARA